MRRRLDAVRRYRDVFTYRDRLAELEALISGAWPALTTLDIGGWKVRAAGGFMREANSVWPLASRHPAALPAAARTHHVESFYLARGLAPRFQIGPRVPTDLQRLLAERGYRPSAPLQVRTARIDAQADGPAPGASRKTVTDDPGGRDVSVSDQPSPRWLSAWAEAAELEAMDQDLAGLVLARAKSPCAYGLIEAPDGMAVIRGVANGGWLGVEVLAGTPALREPAIGWALVRAVARWGVEHDARQAYIRVDTRDTAQQALAANLSSRIAFTYRFWTLTNAGS